MTFRVEEIKCTMVFMDATLRTRQIYMGSLKPLDKDLVAPLNKLLIILPTHFILFQE